MLCHGMDITCRSWLDWTLQRDMAKWPDHLRYPRTNCARLALPLTCSNFPMSPVLKDSSIVMSHAPWVPWRALRMGCSSSSPNWKILSPHRAASPKSNDSACCCCADRLSREVYATAGHATRQKWRQKVSRMGREVSHGRGGSACRIPGRCLGSCGAAS